MLLMPTFILRPGQTSTQRGPRNNQLFDYIDSHINFIIWNCRGVHSDDFRRNFRSLLDYNRPALVVLLETHGTNHQTIQEDFNFTCLIEVVAIDQSGGIAILWLTDVLHVEHVASTAQKIHCHVQVLPNPFKFLFTAIYASPNLANRQLLWANLMCMYDNYKGPWVIGGDFNEIIEADDKFGGLSIDNTKN